MTDYTKATAAELYQAYWTDRTDPVEVAQQTLDRIAKLNPVVNAFCHVDPETTLAQARASADRWRQAQPLSALDGVPVAVKDSILTQGWPTLRASHTVDPNQPWLTDAPVIAQLRQAGAVFVGKTTMSELGMLTSDSNSLIYGQVRNPWNTNASPGGSSGGSAVAVASGMACVALGSDRGGSIAVPSAWCGVFGLKPSVGVMPVYPRDVHDLSCIGPMARSADDIKTVIRLLTPEPKDPTIFVKKKIAVCGDLSEHESLVTWFKNRGCDVCEISLPTDSALKIFDELCLPKVLWDWNAMEPQRRHLAGKKIQRMALEATYQTERTYEFMLQKQALTDHMQNLTMPYDLILCTATDHQAHDEVGTQHPLSPLSVLFAVTGQPTVTMPIGLDSGHMPRSVMMAGSVNQDQALVDLCRIISADFAMPVCPL